VKTAVLLAPYFAPSSMPPALRMGLFARHLPEFGWHPIVLTTETAFLEGPMDPVNQRLLPEGMEIIRTRALPATCTRRIGFSDLSIRGLPFLWSALASLCKRHRPDLVLFSVPPNLTMTLGRLAFHRFRIPYVVDYQDPWVTEDYWRVPKSERPPKWALAYALSRILEPFAIKHVSHITGVSRGTTDSVIARYEQFTEEDTTEIPFGAEPAEFDYLRANPRPNPIFDRTDGLLHVSYVGVCIPAMHESVKAVFRAVRLGLDRRPEWFARVRLHFVGTTYAPGAPQSFQVLPLAREAGLIDVVTEHPERIGYLDALQVMLDSDGLLLVGSNAPHYTASKVFPCILSRRPILAVFHKSSSVVKILRDTRAGAVACFDEEHPPSGQVETIYGHLAGMLAAPSRIEPATDWSAMEQYTARAMTARLARVLDRATAAERRPERD
jgi:hypothetical protein